MTTSMTPSTSGRLWTAATISGGSAPRSAARSSIVSRCGNASPVWTRSSAMMESGAWRDSRATGDLPGSDGSGDEGGVGDAGKRFLEQEGDGGDLAEPGLLEAP